MCWFQSKNSNHTHAGSPVCDVHHRDRRVQIESVELRCVLKAQSVEWRCCRCLDTLQILRMVKPTIIWKLVPVVPDSSEHHAVEAELSAVFIRVHFCKIIPNICSAAALNNAIVACIHKTDTDLRSHFISWYLKLCVPNKVNCLFQFFILKIEYLYKLHSFYENHLDFIRKFHFWIRSSFYPGSIP